MRGASRVPPPEGGGGGKRKKPSKSKQHPSVGVRGYGKTDVAKEVKTLAKQGFFGIFKSYLFCIL